jgi:G6PDH family F420-dependent oxidoreductase
LYTLPDEPPPIVVAAAKPSAATLAGKIGDGFMTTSPDAELVQRYEKAGGKGAKHGKVTGCWGPDPKQALKQAYELWPNTALGGTLGQDLALPRDFEAATATIEPEDLADSLALGDDPDAWLERIAECEQAGFTHVSVHHIGKDQAGFIDFVQREVAPKLT